MTRENKLALVVGFALILFVGILISDHFSAARSQEAADLLPEQDPLVQASYESPDMLSFEPTGAAVADPSPAAGPPALPVDPMVVTPPAEEEIRNPDLQNPAETEPRVGLPAEQTRDLPFVFHNVVSGESLTLICRRHYGDDSLVNELARFNDLSDPDMVTIGTRLRIPAAEHLVRGTPPAAFFNDTATTEIYTVKTGPTP
jgi:hypothetical protein